MGRWGGEPQEGVEICVHKADSAHRTAETNTTLEGNYSPIKEEENWLESGLLGMVLAGHYNGINNSGLEDSTTVVCPLAGFYLSWAPPPGVDF